MSEVKENDCWMREGHFNANFKKIYGFFEFWTIFPNLIKNRRSAKIWKQTENCKNLCIYGLIMKSKQKSADLDNIWDG